MKRASSHLKHCCLNSQIDWLEMFANAVSTRLNTASNETFILSTYWYMLNYPIFGVQRFKQHLHCYNKFVVIKSIKSVVTNLKPFINQSLRNASVCERK